MSNKNYRKQAKVLLVDLEISPTLSWNYGQYETNAIRVERPPILLSFAWQWLGEKKVNCLTIKDCPMPDPLDHSWLVKELWALMDSAEILVAHNCVQKDHKILTADMRWVPASNLKAGDEILGFDEVYEPGEKTHVKNSNGSWKWNGVNNQKRQLKIGKVIANSIKTAHCFKVNLSDGSFIIATDDHPWLVYRNSEHQTVWCEVRNLKAGYRVDRPIIPIEEDHSKDAGYLAAALDGEGCVIYAGKGLHSVQFTQRDNAMWKNVLRILEKEGIKYTICKSQKRGGLGKEDALYLNLRGGKWEMVNNLCRYRPLRLIENIYNRDAFGSTYSPSAKQVEIISIEDAGQQEIASLTTDTKTYIADGYFMHNTNFDVKMANAFFLRQGLNPPRWYKTFCTLKTAKKYFRLDNNKLDYLSQLLGIGQKSKTTHADVWYDMLYGSAKEQKEAAKLMAEYNKNDIVLLKGIYEKLLPFADNHPNMALAAGIENVCPRCGNVSNFRVKAYRKTGAQINAIQYECLSCHGYVTRPLTLEERGELGEEGKLKSTYRNITG